MASIAHMFKPTCLTHVACVSCRACAAVLVDSVDTCRSIHAWVAVTFVDL